MKIIQRVAVWVAANPAISMTLLLLAIAGSMVRITDLKIDASTKGLMDEKDPKKAVYEGFKETFGSDILTVVMIGTLKGQSDVFSSETLSLVQSITDMALDMEGVTSVGSLTTVTNIRGEGDYINTDPLIDGVPEDEDELAVIRDNALVNPTFVGNVVSADGKFAAVNIYTESADDSNFEPTFLRNLEEFIQANCGDHPVYHVGGPRFNVHFTKSIQIDQVTLVPAAVLAILLILFLVFRGPVATSLPMVTGGLSICATVGFMAWMGYSVGPVSVMVPSILIVVGCTEDVHMIAEFHDYLRRGHTVLEAILATASHSALPISLTSATTMLGFAALALNDITALKEFGIVACFGLFANLIVTITVVPAVFRLSKKPPTTGGKLDRLLRGALEKVVTINLNYKKQIAAFTLLAVVIAIFGCMRLQVNNDPISFFRQNTPIRRDFARIHEDLAGAQSFNIVFETEQEGDIKEPEVLQKIASLQTYMNELGELDNVISLVDFVKTMHREMNNDPEAFAVPDNRATVAEYLLLLENDDLFRYVDGESRIANVIVRHNNSGSRDVGLVLDKIRTYIDNNISHYAMDGEVRKINWYFTGEAILLHSATDAMISGQVKSLSLALVAILAIISLLFLSLKVGLIALTSNLIPILLNFGLMGWLGIPFNSGTCLVATIALGIAVDDTIHFMVRYQKELRTLNNQKMAMIATVKAEGAPIMTTSTALALGFAVMMLSQFIPTVHLGFLSALIMIYALVTDLFVNPLMLLSVELITLWDYIGLNIDKKTMHESIIFKGLSESEVKRVILLGSLRRVGRDEKVLREGDAGAEMYVILSGHVRIYLEKNPDNTIAVLEPGQLVGEMALLGEGERTATAEALFDLELLRIDTPALNRVMNRYPRIAAKLYSNISRVLTKRVKEQILEAMPESELRRLDSQT